MTSNGSKPRLLFFRRPQLDFIGRDAILDALIVNFEQSQQRHLRKQRESLSRTSFAVRARDYAGSVETVASPAPCSNACSTARQASIAHLTRCGNFRTPLHHAQIAQSFWRFTCVICHQIVKCAEHFHRFRATFPFQFHRHQRRRRLADGAAVPGELDVLQASVRRRISLRDESHRRTPDYRRAPAPRRRAARRNSAAGANDRE